MKHMVIACYTVLACVWVACDNSDNAHSDEFEYHADIHAPDASNKHLDDTIHIEVEFESHTGMIVHHVNVKIFNKVSGTVVFSKPADAHVHASSGQYVFEDDFILSTAHGIDAHSDYVLEAKVWGHDEGISEVNESIEFHVEP